MNPCTVVTTFCRGILQLELTSETDINASQTLSRTVGKFWVLVLHHWAHGATAIAAPYQGRGFFPPPSPPLPPLYSPRRYSWFF